MADLPVFAPNPSGSCDRCRHGPQPDAGDEPDVVNMSCCNVAYLAAEKITELSPLIALRWYWMRLRGISMGTADLVDFVRSRQAYAFEVATWVNECDQAAAALHKDKRKLYLHVAWHQYWIDRMSLRRQSGARPCRSVVDLAGVHTVKLLNRFCIKHGQVYREYVQPAWSARNAGMS